MPKPHREPGKPYYWINQRAETVFEDVSIASLKPAFLGIWYLVMCKASVMVPRGVLQRKDGSAMTYPEIYALVGKRGVFSAFLNAIEACLETGAFSKDSNGILSVSWLVSEDARFRKAHYGNKLSATGVRRRVYPKVKEKVKMKEKESLRDSSCSEPGPLQGTELEQPLKLDGEQAPLIPPSPTVHTFECVGRGAKTWSVTEADVESWKELYPALDVVHELKRMSEWFLGHPTRRKTSRGIRAFVSNWLSNAQNRGGARSQAPQQQTQSPTHRQRVDDEYYDQLFGQGPTNGSEARKIAAEILRCYPRHQPSDPEKGITPVGVDALAPLIQERLNKGAQGVDFFDGLNGLLHHLHHSPCFIQGPLKFISEGVWEAYVVPWREEIARRQQAAAEERRSKELEESREAMRQREAQKAEEERRAAAEQQAAAESQREELFRRAKQEVSELLPNWTPILERVGIMPESLQVDGIARSFALRGGKLEDVFERIWAHGFYATHGAPSWLGPVYEPIYGNNSPEPRAWKVFVWEASLIQKQQEIHEYFETWLASEQQSMIA